MNQDSDSDSDEDTNGGSDEDANGGTDDEIAAHDRLSGINDRDAMSLSTERIVGRCAGLWLTITLSSLGKTLYSYSQYIRTLNLRELEELLRASRFRAKSSKYAA